MGYFSNLAIEVIELAEEGASPDDIAARLNLSVEDVEEIINEFNSEYKE
jgi:DNA-binding CsgD family transcriptional regulator